MPANKQDPENTFWLIYLYIMKEINLLWQDKINSKTPASSLNKNKQNLIKGNMN